MILQPTHSFLRNVKRLKKKYPSLETDLIELGENLMSDPLRGVSLGRDCYKVRIAISSKKTGKSGGARVITCVKIEGDIIYLLTIFDKSEKETVNDVELTQLLKEIEA